MPAVACQRLCFRITASLPCERQLGVEAVSDLCRTADGLLALGRLPTTVSQGHCFRRTTVLGPTAMRGAVLHVFGLFNIEP
jgi:hypothetical protein